MVEYEVFGPYRIPVKKNVGGRIFDRNGRKKFFSNDLALSALRSRTGCYVFGMRSGGGLTPWYAGKTRNHFEGEVFTQDKIVKIDQMLTSTKIGTAVVFFLSPVIKQGSPPNATTGKLEEFIIGLVCDKNPRALNSTLRGEYKFSIRGVFQHGQGAPTVAACGLRKLLWL